MEKGKKKSLAGKRKRNETGCDLSGECVRERSRAALKGSMCPQRQYKHPLLRLVRCEGKRSLWRPSPWAHPSTAACTAFVLTVHRFLCVSVGGGVFQGSCIGERLNVAYISLLLSVINTAIKQQTLLLALSAKAINRSSVCQTSELIFILLSSVGRYL